MREEWPSCKNFLTDFEGNAKILSILCIGEFYFITFKVLSIREKSNSLNLLPIKPSGKLLKVKLILWKICLGYILRAF